MRTSSLKKALSEIQGAIFDLDGTLIDSMGIWEQIDRDFLKKRGLPDDPFYIESLNGVNYVQAAAFTIEYLKLDTTPEALMLEWDQMAEEQYAEHIAAKEGAREALEFFQNRKIPIVLATVSGRNLYEPCLKRLGLYEYFDAFTSDLKGKEDADIFLRAAKAAHASPENCLVFEDSKNALMLAHGAGFMTVAVYDERNHRDWDEMICVSDFCIDSLRELVVEDQSCGN